MLLRDQLPLPNERGQSVILFHFYHSEASTFLKAVNNS
jgi:hypothetical protein